MLRGIPSPGFRGDLHLDKAAIRERWDLRIRVTRQTNTASITSAPETSPNAAIQANVEAWSPNSILELIRKFIGRQLHLHIGVIVDFLAPTLATFSG